MHIHIFPKETLAKETAKALNNIFASQKNAPFLFLSSGGSSLALLEYINEQNFGPRSMVSVLDERYSNDPAVNNFTQLSKTDFYKKTKDAGTHFIDTRPQQNESKEMLAQRFEHELRSWMKNNPNGKIIATIGMGPDAHVSGIMPYPEDPNFFEKTFNNTDKWVIAYDADDKNQYPLRITVTMPFLRKIDVGVSFVQDDSKRPALAKLGAKTGSLNATPCRILLELPSLGLFTDQKV